MSQKRKRRAGAAPKPAAGPKPPRPKSPPRSKLLEGIRRMQAVGASPEEVRQAVGSGRLGKRSMSLKQVTKIAERSSRRSKVKRAAQKAAKASASKPPAPVARCGAIRANGQPCERPCHKPRGAKRRRSHCRQHGGKSTGPRTPEGRARIAASNQQRAAEQRAKLERVKTAAQATFAKVAEGLESNRKQGRP